MRHFDSGAARRAAATAGIPIINAGDGPGQHPTQVLENKFLNGVNLCLYILSGCHNLWNYLFAGFRYTFRRPLTRTWKLFINFYFGSFS